MTRTDTGLRFWLRYVQDAGGLCEDAGDSAIAVLPETLQREYRQPEEMVVTADPDVAREDGAVLLLAGHPLLMHAAEAVLDEGDCGVCGFPGARACPRAPTSFSPWPATSFPSTMAGSTRAAAPLRQSARSCGSARW